MGGVVLLLLLVVLLDVDCVDVDMALNLTPSGCSLKAGYTCMSNKPLLDIPQLHRRDIVSYPLLSQTHPKNLVYRSSKGMKLLCHSYSASPFTRGETRALPHTIPILPKRGELGVPTDTILQLPRRNPMYHFTRTSKGIAYSHRYQTAEKPKWWWRVLACLPYVVPLHAPWMNAETMYQMHPFLENFEFLTYPFLRAYVKLPSWAIMASVTALYLGVVRRKECPHFFRYHVVMGILLESCMHVIGTICTWMPCEVFWGKFGLLFWSAIAFAYLLTVVECIKCAVSGRYPDIPLLSDSAITHIPYR